VQTNIAEIGVGMLERHLYPSSEDGAVRAWAISGPRTVRFPQLTQSISNDAVMPADGSILHAARYKLTSYPAPSTVEPKSRPHGNLVEIARRA
jgi:hypothetical protein